MYERICGIYCIENKINHKKYIGLSVDCIGRWFDHRSLAFVSKNEGDKRKVLYRAMRKYGLENFSFQILEKCPKESLKEREIYWIAYYNTYETGYNATRGGDLPEGHVLQGEEHGMHRLTEDEVIQCRKWYAEGRLSRDVYENELNFKEKVKYSGFQSMWHGKTWKHIMPEVFENNPHPFQKVTQQDVIKIRTLWFQGETVSEIDEIFKDVCSHSTISGIVNNKRYTAPEYYPNIPDNHKLNRKLTDDEIRQVRKWKSEGRLNKEIKTLLNNKVSMTTISDILTGKRYSEIK